MAGLKRASSRGRLRSLIVRSVALARLSVLVAAYAGASPARAQCRDQDDQLAAGKPTPGILP